MPVEFIEVSKLFHTPVAMKFNFVRDKHFPHTNDLVGVTATVGRAWQIWAPKVQAPHTQFSLITHICCLMLLAFPQQRFTATRPYTANVQTEVRCNMLSSNEVSAFVVVCITMATRTATRRLYTVNVQTEVRCNMLSSNLESKFDKIFTVNNIVGSKIQGEYFWNNLL